jgi:hypothetical protein
MRSKAYILYELTCSIKISDVEDSETLQVTNFLIPPSSDNIVKHLRFTIREGHSDFCAVARVVIAGESLGSRERADEVKSSEESLEVQARKTSSSNRRSESYSDEREGRRNNGILVGGSDEF